MQAELSIKTGSPLFEGNNLPPQMPAPMMSAPLQRAAVSRQHARRSYQSVNGRASSASQYMPRPTSFAMSPTNQPTPPSHASSPAAASNRSVNSMHQTGLPSPASAAPSTSSQSHPSSAQYRHSSAMSTISTSSSRSGSTIMPQGARNNHAYGFPTQYPKAMEHLGKYPRLLRAH